MIRCVTRCVTALAMAAGLATAAWAQSVTLPVPMATIYPGDVIEAGQLGEHTFPQSQAMDGFADSPKALIGKIARRTLLPGHPVPVSAVGEVNLVTRGTPVQLVFKESGLVITAFASPLQDGSAGDLIRVRNADSGAIVVGVVEADGTVRVGQR